MPSTVAPLLGEAKVGTAGTLLGSGSVSPPNSEQANPETSIMHKSNTIVILECFIFCLQLVQEISRRMFYN